jgi:hypothetical protein
METNRALTKPQRLLLLEAARRYKEYNPGGDSLTDALSGLGTAREYKTVEDADLMRVCTQAGIDRPNTIYWWKLTPSGAAIVRILVSALSVDQIVTELKKEKGL